MRELGKILYAKKGAAIRDIEWAIQNGRVVLQSMQLRADEVSRVAADVISTRTPVAYAPP